MRTIKAVWVLAAGLLLAACGGGSDVCYGGPGSTACATSTSTTATALTIALDKTTISNSGADTVTATATAATAGGQTVSGVPVSFAVDNGAVFTADSTSTSAAGVVTAAVSVGANRANRTITVVATSGSLSATASFVVTGATLGSTPVPAVVAPSSAGQVDFILKDAAGSPMAGQAISVVAGAAAPADGVTDSNGAYKFSYTAPATAGTLSVVAKAGGVEKTQDVLVQMTSAIPPALGTPTSATVAANPSVVAPNVDISTNYRAEVRALFLDASNNPIPNMRVRFLVNNSYGTFSTEGNIVYSDGNGRAVTSFIPGARTSPKNGVTISACYANVDFTSCGDAGVTTITTTLTVAAEVLSISITTNRRIDVTDPLTYKQQFTVTAVDIAGRPKANVDITPSIDLQYYLKGQYVYDGTRWINVCTDPLACAIVLPGPVGCQNEDIGRTGFYQASEDINLNGKIDPSKADIIVSAVGSTKTDAAGKMTLQIEYGKNLGSWLQYQILVSAGVAGTEGRKTWVDVLGVPITDIETKGAPPFVRSPYGVVTTTAVPSIDPGRGPVPPCQNAD